MYSEQLEQLIKSVIADGVITEKERAVLHKKAASEGVDEDEIDVYIDGLVAQMKPTVKQEQKFDLKYLNKSKKDTYTVYEGKNLYRVNGFAVGRIQELYLNFFKKIEKDDEQLGISVIIVYKEGMTALWPSHPRLFINTPTCELDLEDGKEWVNVPAKVMSSKRYANVYCFELDRDMLKAVCESEKIFMSLIGLETIIRDGDDRETIDFNKIAIHDFATFAQVFYRSVIDSSSYQNAELDSDLLAAISEGKIAEYVKSSDSFNEEFPLLAKYGITKKMAIIYLGIFVLFLAFINDAENGYETSAYIFLFLVFIGVIAWIHRPKE